MPQQGIQLLVLNVAARIRVPLVEEEPERLGQHVQAELAHRLAKLIEADTAVPIIVELAE
jgi:hypothetical protein